MLFDILENRSIAQHFVLLRHYIFSVLFISIKYNILGENGLSGSIPTQVGLCRSLDVLKLGMFRKVGRCSYLHLHLHC